MNFLELCQRGATECGVSGTISTVAGNSGSQARIVNWIGDAWNDLQIKYDDWEWMRSSNILGSGVSFATVAGQFSYPLGTGAGTVGVAADSFGKWDEYSFRVQTTTVGVQDETFLDNILYDQWRNSYMLGAMRAVQTRPVAIAVGPDRSLNLGPPPNALYTVTGDYWVAPSAMEDDDDVPTGLPPQFHMLIVYGCMKKYAYYESAPEVLASADMQHKPMMDLLEKNRGAVMGWGGALA